MKLSEEEIDLILIEESRCVSQVFQRQMAQIITEFKDSILESAARLVDQAPIPIDPAQLALAIRSEQVKTPAKWEEMWEEMFKARS